MCYSLRTISTNFIYPLVYPDSLESRLKKGEIKAEEMQSVNVPEERYDISHFDRFEDKIKSMAKKDYKTVIAELKTPVEVKFYCGMVLKYESDEKLYGAAEYWPSFKRIHKRKRGDCDDGAIAAAAILSDDGFPPYILCLSRGSDNKSGHAVFLYKDKRGLFGSMGINAREDTYMPTHKTTNINGLIDALNAISNDNYKTYKIYDLRKINPDFIDKDF